MKVFKGFLYSLPSQGYITLQIPALSLSLDGKHPERIDCPDEWFFQMYNGVPCTMREKGFIKWTRIGWLANKEKIKEAFLASPTPRGTWADFEKYAEEFYKELQKKAEKKMDYHERKRKAIEKELCRVLLYPGS